MSLIRGDARALPVAGGAVQCVVTSPPYWGLRNYGTGRWVGGDPACTHKGDKRWYTEQTAAVEGSLEAFSVAGEANAERIKKGRWREAGTCRCGALYQDAQLGLEATPDEYVASMVAVFREVWRVLRDDGTLWLNLGDSYNAGVSSPRRNHTTPNPDDTRSHHFSARSSGEDRRDVPGLKPKDLVGIPWRVAFALQADGWTLRQDIVWAKGNPMPESVRDRCTKAHEYVFLLTKRQRYYYDAEAIAEPSQANEETRKRAAYGRYDAGDGEAKRHTRTGKPDYLQAVGNDNGSDTRNRRSVWVVNTQPYPQAHFATFPEKLVEPCVLAGSKAGDLVMDPFAGSGTVGAVCRRFARRFVGVELNPAYVALAQERLKGQVGLALEGTV